MNNPVNPIDTLSEIRSIMDRSTRFISLSGLSGIFAGTFAILGALAVWGFGKFSCITNYNPLSYEMEQTGSSFPWITLTIAIMVLIGAVCSAVFFTSRYTRKKGLPLWDKTSKRFLTNLLIPLAVGGLFALILILKGYLELVAPVTLLFYGLALLNGSKYTLDEIRYLAYTQMILGLASACFIGWGLIFWTIGFGICHIVYGIKMYYKYEQ